MLFKFSKMQFHYSNHSLEQMELRNISKQVVALVMNNPDSIINEEENQQIFQKVIAKYLYRVFVAADKNPVVIKTEHRTSKIYKYDML